MVSNISHSTSSVCYILCNRRLLLAVFAEIVDSLKCYLSVVVIWHQLGDLLIYSGIYRARRTLPFWPLLDSTKRRPLVPPKPLLNSSISNVNLKVLMTLSSSGAQRNLRSMDKRRGANHWMPLLLNDQPLVLWNFRVKVQFPLHSGARIQYIKIHWVYLCVNMFGRIYRWLQYVECHSILLYVETFVFVLFVIHMGFLNTTCKSRLIFNYFISVTYCHNCFWQ